VDWARREKRMPRIGARPWCRKNGKRGKSMQLIGKGERKQEVTNKGQHQWGMRPKQALAKVLESKSTGIRHARKDKEVERTCNSGIGKEPGLIYCGELRKEG